MHAGVRHREVRAADAGVAVQEQVQVQRAGSVAVGPLTPGLQLQRQQVLQKIGCGLGRVQRGHGIHKVGALGLERCGAVQVGQGLHLYAGPLRHLRHRPAQGLRSLAQIGTQANVGSDGGAR